MPDITKCNNALCQLKDSCYRYTCKASEFSQSFATFKPDDEGKCDFFIDNKL